MIVNTTIYNGDGVTTPTTTVSTSNEIENILKRKHQNSNKNLNIINDGNGKNFNETNHYNSNNVHVNNDIKNNSIEFVEDNDLKWKKRHMEGVELTEAEQLNKIELNGVITEATAPAATTTRAIKTIATTTETIVVITAPAATLPSPTTTAAVIAPMETATTATSATTANAHFNIVTNNHFVNDLIDYETNLLIPITSQGPQSDIDLIEEDISLFSTSPKAVYVNAMPQQQFDNTIANDNDNWHSTDLLELDHRYNSNLQTEINQINPTIRQLKVTELPAVQAVHSLNHHLHKKNFRNSVKDRIENFLIPLTAITATTIITTTTNTTTTTTIGGRGFGAAAPAAVSVPASATTAICDALQVDLPIIVEEEISDISTMSMRQQQQQQQQQQHDIEQDYFEDKNLSWLLNFKFDELPHLSPDLTKSGRYIPNNNNNNNNSNNYQYSLQNVIVSQNDLNETSLPTSSLSSASLITTAATTTTIPIIGHKIIMNGTTNNKHQRNLQQQSHQHQQHQPNGGRSSKNAIKVNKKFEELVMEVTSSDNNNCDDDIGQYNLDNNNQQQQQQQQQQREQQEQQQQQRQQQSKQQQHVNYSENATTIDLSILAQKKPPFTYTELIEYALEDKGELTVSGIYQWISDRFAYYKSNDDRWKNSVRHNLSINPHFRKGIKAPQGAGHLWTIYSSDSAENVLQWEHKKQRLELFFKMEALNRERILEYQQQQQLKKQHIQNGENQMNTFTNSQTDCNSINDTAEAYDDEAAIAVNAIQQEMLQQQQQQEEQQQQEMAAHTNNDQCNSMVNVLDSNAHVLHAIPYTDLLCNDEELRKTAGQILNGIHREVEVQAVNQNIISTYQDVLLDNEDYLNSVHKNDAGNQNNLRQQHHQNAITTKIARPLSSSSTITLPRGNHYMTTNSNHNTTPQYYVTDIEALELNGIQIPTHNVRNLNNSCNNLVNDNCSRNDDNVGKGNCSVNSGDCNEDSDVDLFNDEYNFNCFSYSHNNDSIS